MPQVIGVCLLLAQVLASSQLPRLRPRIILPGEGVTSSFWLLAPNIAVVTIRSARRIGPDVEITPPRKLLVHLVSVEAQVEDVITGELSQGTIQFYFFANTLIPNVGYTTQLSRFEQGKRYVVFLRKDGTVFRTMADLTEPNIRIRSGHKGRSGAAVPPVVPNDLGAVIASDALTPTKDRDQDFARTIGDTFDRLLLLSSPAKLGLLLRKLLENPDRDIRDHACLTLSINFQYRDPCFENLQDSTDPIVRQQAKTWAPRKLAAQQRILTAFKEAPLSLSASGKVDDLASDLELFTFDWDAEIRQRACDTLRIIFPIRQFLSCLVQPPAQIGADSDRGH